MKRNFLFNSITIFIVLLPGIVNAQMPNFPPDTTVRDAPDFSLTDLNGVSIVSDDLKGDIVVVNFWGIKCQPCVQEIPGLNQLMHELDTLNVHFIGITGDSTESVKEFLIQHPFEYTLCAASDYQKLMIQFNPFPAVPLHFIINKDWKIVYRHVGKLDSENLLLFKQMIKELL